LIRAGEDVKTVQALGHAIAVETWETYAGLWSDNEQRTRAAVDGLGLSSKVQRRRGRSVLTARRRPKAPVAPPDLPKQRVTSSSPTLPERTVVQGVDSKMRVAAEATVDKSVVVPP
jgi:hypothetical protein